MTKLEQKKAFISSLSQSPEEGLLTEALSITRQERDFRYKWRLSGMGWQGWGGGGLTLPRRTRPPRGGGPRGGGRGGGGGGDKPPSPPPLSNSRPQHGSTEHKSH